MEQFYNLASIHQTALRCREEGIPLAEKAIRKFIHNGKIPAVMSGKKALLLWENVLKFVKEGSD